MREKEEQEEANRRAEVERAEKEKVLKEEMKEQESREETPAAASEEPVAAPAGAPEQEKPVEKEEKED